MESTHWWSSRPARLAAATVVFLLNWFNIVTPPGAAVTPDIDFSWAGALSYFANQGFQYGRDVIYTFGPLGYLISPIYSGYAFGARIAWEIGSSIAFAAILTLAFFRLPAFWRAPFLLFSLLFFYGFDWIHMLVYAVLAAELFRRGTDQPALNLAAAAVLGATSLIKFTYFIVAVLLVICVCGRYLTQKRLVPAVTLAAGFLVVHLLAWMAAGQELANLFSYVGYSLEMTSGYKAAMAYPASSRTIILCGAIAVLVTFALLALVFLAEPRWRRIWIPPFFGGAVFMMWNHGFVRADMHVLGFFTLCPLLAILVWNATSVERRVRRVGYTLTGAVLLLCLAGIWKQDQATIKDSFARFRGRMRVASELLTAPADLKLRLDQSLAEQKSRAALPRVRAEVGSATIDVFGYEQGVALLNELNYTPRPVFQSYCVYTPTLIDTNAAFFRSERAPTYVLLKVQAIDGRVPTLDDAGALREILFRYTFLFEEGGYFLWKRRPHISDPGGTLQPHAERTARLGKRIWLPEGNPVWVELKLKPSLLGVLRHALYKPPDMFLRTRDINGGKEKTRIIPAMATRGFLVSPRVENGHDFVRLASGENLPAVESFTVDSEKEDRRYFRNRFEVKFHSAPPPVIASP